MAIGDVIRVSVASTDGNRDFFNTFHYAEDAGGSGPTDCTLFSSDFITAWTGLLIPAACSTTTFEFVSSQCLLGPSAGNIGVAGFPPATVGGLGASDMPPEICINITRKIPMAGRKFRGRLFWGPTVSGMFLDPNTGRVDVTHPYWAGLSTICTSTFTSGGNGYVPVLVGGAGKPVVYTRTPGYITTSLTSGRNGDRRRRKDRELV